ncbi:F-BAR and double SH3 domains protein 2 [Mactra antiquata]
MEFFTYSSEYTSKWRTSRMHLQEIYASYIFVFILLLVQSVHCDHEKGHKTEARNLRLVIEYGNHSTEEISDAGYYGEGSKINSVPITGQLVHLKSVIQNKSDYGCEEIDKDKVPSSGAWVALVQRGQCHFNTKIYYAAKRSNASAVIVYNSNTKADQTLTVKGEHDVGDVVAVLITYSKGELLIDRLRSHQFVNITLTRGQDEPPRPENNGQLNNTSVLFVSISFIVLIIISLAWLVFYYIQRCRYTNAKERLSRRLANAAKKAIAKIPQRSIKIGDKELDTEADQCAVCIESYKWNDVIRVLPCKHIFHKSCVDPWLLDQRSCPMCKMDILRAFGLHLNDSQESVPQDADSGLMSSTPAADETEHLSNSEEQGAVGGVKIVLYQRPVHYRNSGSGQFNELEFSSDASLDLRSSPVAQCHVECTGQAIVEHNSHNDLCTEDEPCLARCSSSVSLHSADEEEDTNDMERRSLMTGASLRGCSSMTSLGSKSLRANSDTCSVCLSIKE